MIDIVIGVSIADGSCSKHELKIITMSENILRNFNLSKNLFSFFEQSLSF